MKPLDKALEEIGSKTGTRSQITALVGLDGFVDKLVTPVSERRGPGDNFTPIPTINDFASRIAAAAGKSANIELAPKVEKLGGNGPIMANALLSHGLQVRYVGALGKGTVHPVFEDFARNTKAISITDPGITHAAEFNDGKIMLGTMSSLEEVTYQQIIDTMTEGAFFELLSRVDLMAWVNWTMIPHMSAFFTALLDKVLPSINTMEPRHIFFDLADPFKRSRSDLSSVLELIKRFQSFGNVTFGMNFSEALQVDKLLFNSAPVEPTEIELKKMSERIFNKLGIGCVVIHPTDSAACTTREGSSWVAGPFCDNPKTTTGAGDHFNAGFMTGQLCGMSPLSSLVLAVSNSGYYVRTGKSPSIQDLDSFIREWKS